MSPPDSPPPAPLPLSDTLIASVQQGKKKKKKKKRANRDKSTAKMLPVVELPVLDTLPVLSISRNKHWKYISSYHGPWLQLPLELLESLFALNCDPATSALRDEQSMTGHVHEQRHKPVPPPPIDPGVFRSVLSVRRLVEEATNLAVRASSGLSSAALASLPNSSSLLFGDPLPKCGRNATMSATRAHRLRVLAVQRLADAYKADEIATSVMVMQGATSLEDIAERVLSVDPNDFDAQYVHFFHEKIPSRQLAEFTTTDVLDTLITSRPQCLELFRTRGIVHCFLEDYTRAVRDFTHALKESRAARKARHLHIVAEGKDHLANSKRSKRCANKKTNGQAPPDGTSAPDSMLLHPSVLPDPPEPLELQTLFLRGSAHLQHSVHIIEHTLLDLEKVRKPGCGDQTDMRFSYIENGRYGGLEIGHPDGPLGPRDGEKRCAYVNRMGGDVALRENVDALARKAIRDYERFIAHFDRFSSTSGIPLTEAEAMALVPRHGGKNLTTTYHPLLVEAHFSILIALLLLGDFSALFSALLRVSTFVDSLEGYPVFLPARSIAQAEFIEMLDRLSCGWENGSYEGPAPGPPHSPLEFARAVLKTFTSQLSNDGGVGPDNKRGIRRTSFSFPMHGPRVELVLAWLGAVHQPALDEEAKTIQRHDDSEDSDYTRCE